MAKEDVKMRKGKSLLKTVGSSYVSTRLSTVLK